MISYESEGKETIPKKGMRLETTGRHCLLVRSHGRRIPHIVIRISQLVTYN